MMIVEESYSINFLKGRKEEKKKKGGGVAYSMVEETGMIF